MPVTEAGHAKETVCWLKPEQVESMRNAVHENGYNVGQRDEAIITLLYDTGLRRNELRLLNRDLLDLEDETLRLPTEIQKQWPHSERDPPAVTMELDPHGDLRTVKTLRAYLNTRDDDERPLFVSNWGNRMHFNTIYRRVKFAAVNAGVEPWTKGGRGEATDVGPHSLRHSLAYRYIRLHGETMYRVKQRLRHGSLQTTEREYSHFDVV